MQMEMLDGLDFTKANGLVTVVAQDAMTGAVLMVAHADREALERTIQTGEMHYRSRTRGLWHKGATSGNVQRVVSLSPDCDGDAVLARVRPAGPSCHTGAVSCFGDAALGADELGVLDGTVARRASGLADLARSSGVQGTTDRGEGATASAANERGAPPEPQDPAAHADIHHPSDSPTIGSSPPRQPVGRSSYTQQLLTDRNLRLKKIGEEAAELVVACADSDRPRAAEEGADLVYHTLVALRAIGVGLDDVRQVLASRRE